jgi:hypothetical protein
MPPPPRHRPDEQLLLERPVMACGLSGGEPGRGGTGQEHTQGCHKPGLATMTVITPAISPVRVRDRRPQPGVVNPGEQAGLDGVVGSFGLPACGPDLPPCPFEVESGVQNSKL